MTSVIDLTASDEKSAGPSRTMAVAAGWLAGWSAIVLAMAALVSAQKGVPLRHTLFSEALNYYTLAALSLVVWHASGQMAARRWTWPVQSAVHVALGLCLIAVWQAIYGLYLRSVIGPRAWESLFRGVWMFQMMNAS